MAGYAAPPEPERPIPEARHVAVDHPGELVGMDCFHVGRLSGTSGRVWQYTAIDLASSYVWAELHTTPLNPAARKTSGLARRVALDLEYLEAPSVARAISLLARTAVYLLRPRIAGRAVEPEPYVFLGVRTLNGPISGATSSGSFMLDQ